MPFCFPWQKDDSVIKPTIAVMKFENRSSGGASGWNLSEGMPEILVDRLVATGRYQVLERAEMQSIKNELELQKSGQTRTHNRVAAGRLKNVQYLIKGTITEFGIIQSNSVFAGTGGWNIFGDRNKAVISMTLYVVDVESGQIMCSEPIEESVGAGNLDSQASLKGVGFGGTQFNQTPLGHATTKAIDQAVKKITQTIAVQKWQPKIALIGADQTVVLNGGQDRKVKNGDCYEVVQSGDPVLDPDSGDVIGSRQGHVIGRIQITGVEAMCSNALIVNGHAEDFKVGQQCRLVK